LINKPKIIEFHVTLIQTFFLFYFSMPNKYKRTVGSRPYKNYSEHTLQRCLLAVKTKHMTQREAEKAFKIPRRTIINKLKAHHVQPVGRPIVFTEPETWKHSCYE